MHQHEIHQQDSLDAAKLKSIFRLAAKEITFTSNTELFDRIPNGLDGITDANCLQTLFEFLAYSNGDVNSKECYKARVTYKVDTKLGLESQRSGKPKNDIKTVVDHLVNKLNIDIWQQLGNKNFNIANIEKLKELGFVLSMATLIDFRQPSTVEHKQKLSTVAALFKIKITFETTKAENLSNYGSLNATRVDTTVHQQIEATNDKIFPL